MRSNGVRAAPIDEASGQSSQQQQRPSRQNLPGSRRLGVRNYAVSEQPRSYPATTAHYGECAYVIDEYRSSSEQDPWCNHLSAPGSRNAHLDTSPHSFNANTAPRDRSGRIRREEHERVVNQNLQLSRGLQEARQDAERANEAVRDLAAWAYHERERLTRALAEERTANEHNIEEAMDQEGLIYNQAANAFLAQEVNDARREVGLPPLSDGDMGIRLGLRVPLTVKATQTRQTVTQNKNRATLIRSQMSDSEGAGYSTPDADSFEPITSQVDALIAAERDGLPKV